MVTFAAGQRTTPSGPRRRCYGRKGRKAIRQEQGGEGPAGIFASGSERYWRIVENIINFTLHLCHSGMIYMNNNSLSQVQ
jgi:hypothetical protein